MPNDLTRRTFLAGSGALAAASTTAAAPAERGRGPNDRITVGMIAVGSRAHELLEAIKKVEGTEIVGVCDAYTGRLERAVYRTGGRAKIYKDHHEILADKSIDVVTVASPDHWHKQHVLDALAAGKDVYCEKPLTYTIDEGLEIAEAVKKSGRLVQVGSQPMSSRTQHKAREIIRSGKLGQVTMIRASYNRNSASGAWIYPIPPDASSKTVDWEMFLGSAPKHPFSLERFFRWRCYWDYSGGIATDLFVHLCTTIHFLMDATAPKTAVGMGQLYRWKESRNVPDTLNAVLEYPEGFAVNLSSTFNNNSSAGSAFQILGTEGTIILDYGGLKFIPERRRENNRWIVEAWPRDLQQQYYQDPKVRKMELPGTREPEIVEGMQEFTEVGRDMNVQHFQYFFDSVRNRKPTVQDEWAGHHAAACAHLINNSLRGEQFVHWDFDRHRQKT